MYKRQQQNFLLLPRLGIPVNNNVGLAIQLHLSVPASGETTEKSVHLFHQIQVCSYGGMHGSSLRNSWGSVPPCHVLNQAEGWKVWNAVVTFGFLNTREPWSSWSRSRGKDAEGLEHLPAQEGLGGLGLFSLQRSHLDTALIHVDTGDGGQHLNNRNNIQCLSRHF